MHYAGFELEINSTTACICAWLHVHPAGMRCPTCSDTQFSTCVFVC